MNSPDIATIASIRSVVTPGLTARALADGEAELLPSMFATPFMIAFMERACAQLLAPLLKPGELSVGARIEVAHLAPTAIGSAVVCSARFVETQGPLYWFDVWADDDRRRIGKGRIARAIVAETELTARAGA
jgi:fluoroacetyl-CoA thioesterase